MRTPKTVRRVVVLFNTPFLYGMERAVIELFSSLKPEIRPLFVMTQVTKRENLPVLREIQQRQLEHVFWPDHKPWPKLGKPRSLSQLLRMTWSLLRGSIALLKAGISSDALYVGSLRSAPYAIPLAAYYRLRHRPVVHHFHDLKNNRVLLRIWAAFVTDFVHNSAYCRQTVLSAHAFLASKRNHVLPYILDLSESKSCPEFSGTRNLIIAGQVSPHKGIDYGLEAFARIAPDYPDAVIHIVGTCAKGYESEFHRRLVAAQANGNVKFWGYLENVLDLLGFSYLHVMPTPPSRFQESFPRAALEAMASGVPTICFRSGGLQDMIEDGTTGILCAEESVEALAKAMAKFLADPGYREFCGNNARQRYLREYSPVKLRGRWLKILAKVPDEESN